MSSLATDKFDMDINQFTSLKFGKLQAELDSFMANSHGNEAEQFEAINFENTMLLETERASLLLAEHTKSTWKSFSQKQWEMLNKVYAKFLVMLSDFQKGLTSLHSDHKDYSGILNTNLLRLKSLENSLGHI